MMHSEKPAETPIGRLIKALNYIGMASFFLILVVLATADVVLRYLFRMPIRGGLELYELALAVMVFFALSYTAISKGHIAVDLLAARFPARIRAVLDAVSGCIGIVIWGLIGWQGFFRALDARAHNDITDVLTIPMWPFRLLVPLGAALLILALINVIAESRNKMRHTGD